MIIFIKLLLLNKRSFVLYLVVLRIALEIRDPRIFLCKKKPNYKKIYLEAMTNTSISIVVTARSIRTCCV